MITPTVLHTPPGVAPILDGMELANACEIYRDGTFWGQPANSVTSLAFVAAAAAILAVPGQRSRWAPYAGLVAAVGIGSLIQHGPNPEWQAYAHDLPMVALLAYVAVDAAADLTGRSYSLWWWVAPTVAAVPVIAVSHVASSVAQGVLAGAAIGLNLLRARARPELRRTLITALALLTLGAIVGTLSDRTTLCQPESLLQGHALWHLLAALALWRLAPAIGFRGTVAPMADERPLRPTTPDGRLQRRGRWPATRRARQAIPGRRLLRRR